MRNGSEFARVAARQVLTRLAARCAIQKAAAEMAGTQEYQHPLLHRLYLGTTVMNELRQNNRTGLVSLTRNYMEQLGLDERGIVFRGLSHPAGVLTDRLVCTYGTDRFVGYGPGNYPTAVEGLQPYRNRGDSAPLTADTYGVPDLHWALAFTGLADTGGADALESGNRQAFLLLYDAAQIHVERTPGNAGGEQWRATFTTDPSQALLALIQYMPESEQHGLTRL